MNPHTTGGGSGDSPLKGWLFLAACVFAVGAALSGAYGLARYEATEGKHHSPPEWSKVDSWSVGYHTLQLFVLHAPHLDGHVSGWIHFGRWGIALVVLATVITGLVRLFRSESRLFFARWHSGHVVICGLGRLGLQLALEFRRGGKRVVAIEARGSNDRIAIADDAGVAVITGDACDRDNLRRALVNRAEQVIAVCGDEQTNVAVAAVVGEELADRPSRRPTQRPLECWMFVADTRLREMFRKEGLFPHPEANYRVNVRGLDLFELAARQAIIQMPLDYDRIGPSDSTRVHLVIVGFGLMGQHLALQAASIGHFANSQKLALTIVEHEDSSRPKDFLARHKRFREVCDLTLTTIPGRPDAQRLFTALRDRREDTRQLLTIALCWDSNSERHGTESDLLRALEHDDATNLSTALTVAAADLKPRFLVFQTRKRGFGALFPVLGRGKAISPRLHAFGMMETTCSLETLLHEDQDAIARELHNDYLVNQRKAGNEPGTKPALYPWDELAERFKDSNRQAADHIPVKLRAIGYRVDRLRKDLAPLSALDDAGEVELLAEMEHKRWSAELTLHGYSYAKGKRDDIRKTHPCLLPWHELDPQTQEWDRQQVRAIPEALRRAKYGIYPQTQ